MQRAIASTSDDGEQVEALTNVRLLCADALSIQVADGALGVEDVQNGRHAPDIRRQLRSLSDEIFSLEQRQR